MELLAPLFLAVLFVVFGLSQRGRGREGCGACTGGAACRGGQDCARHRNGERG